MKKFFKFGKNKKGGADSKSLSKASSELSLSGPGYALKEKDLGKLHKAAWVGDLDKVKQLAKKDASPIDKENRTPLHLACARGHATIVQELLEWKAKTNVGDSDARTPLIKATQCHQLQCVQLLLDHRADPNAQDVSGDTSLHYAARDGIIMILEALLRCGNINIDVRNKEGQSALMVGTLAQQIRSVQLLLQNGADPDQQDQEGRTALMIVCKEGNTELVHLLLEARASTVIKDIRGWTADDIAIMSSQDACRELMAEYSIRTGGGKPGGVKPPLQPPMSDESEDEEEGAAAAAPKASPPKRLNNGALAKASSNDMFGLPAQNEDDISAADDTASKMSEAGGMESWADTDEDSELEPKKKKLIANYPIYENIAEVTEVDLVDDLDQGQGIPNLDLSKVLRGSTDDLTKIGEKTVNRSASGASDTNRSKIPISKKDSQPSARSAASAASAGDENTWSDNDDSLFSSARDKTKPSLLKPQFSSFGKGAPTVPAKPESKPKLTFGKQDDSEWSDNDSLPMASERRTTAIRTTTNDKGANKDAEPSDWDESNKSESKAAEKNKAKAMTPERKKAVMAELGLSDVSDVSDPDLSEAGEEGPSLSKPASKALHKEDSDWDSTQASEVNTGRGKPPPLSARSEASEWDSTVDEEAPPIAKALSVSSQRSMRSLVRQKTQEGENHLDSIKESLEKENRRDIKATVRVEDTSNWDSASEVSSKKSNKTDSVKLNTAANQNTADAAGKAGEELHSGWDSDEGSSIEAVTPTSDEHLSLGDKVTTKPPEQLSARGENDDNTDAESEYDDNVVNEAVEQALRKKSLTSQKEPSLPKPGTMSVSDSISSSEYDDDIVNAAVDKALQDNSAKVDKNKEPENEANTADNMDTDMLPSDTSTSEFDDDIVNEAVEKALKDKSASSAVKEPDNNTADMIEKESSISLTASESELDDNAVNAAVERSIQKNAAANNTTQHKESTSGSGILHGKGLPVGNNSSETLNNRVTEKGVKVTQDPEIIDNMANERREKVTSPDASTDNLAKALNTEKQDNTKEEKELAKANTKPVNRRVSSFSSSSESDHGNSNIPLPALEFDTNQKQKKATNNDVNKPEDKWSDSDTEEKLVSVKQAQLPNLPVEETQRRDAAKNVEVQDGDVVGAAGALPNTAAIKRSESGRQDLLSPPPEFKGSLETKVKPRRKSVTFAEPILLPSNVRQLGSDEAPHQTSPRNTISLADELAQCSLPGFHARQPRGSQNASAAAAASRDDEDEDSKWDSDDGLPLSDDNSKPMVKTAAVTMSTKPIVAAKPTIAAKPAVAAKPTLVGGMMAGSDDDDDDEDTEEESEWEKEKRLKDQKKESEEERMKKWNNDFEKKQEELRHEAQEELRREREEAERERREQEENERKEKEAEERRKEQEKKKDEEKKKEEKRIAEEKQMKEQEERKREEDRKRQQEEEKRRAEERKKQQEEDRKREEERKDQEKKEQLQREEEAKNKLNNSAISNHVVNLNKQPASKPGPELPPKPKTLPSPRINALTSTPRSGQQHHDFDDEDDDTFNNDQLRDLASPRRPSLSMIGHAPGLPPSGHKLTNGGGGVVNGSMVADEDDDCLSYSSTEQDVSEHAALNSQPLQNSVNLSFGTDSMSMLRQQEQLREVRRLLDKERSTRLSIENKKRHMETERIEVLQKLEDVTRAKSQLEQEKITLEAKIRALDYKVTEEAEKRKSAEILYNKTKDQLSRKEDQYTLEAEARQKADLNMRNIQMELRTALAQIKQLEEEKEDLMRQMQHEKNSRLLQEQINEELTSFQKALTQGPIPDQSEMLSKFEEADETRRHAQNNVEKLNAELYALKMELERQRNRAKDDHSLLTSENDDLLSKIEELKSDLKLNEDALNQATMQYNINMSQLKMDNTRLVTSWEKEREGKEKLEAEVGSLNSRLQALTAELDKLHAARSDLERNNYKSHEELSKQLDRREQELASLKEAKQNLQDRLSAAEAKVNSYENEIHVINATLMERSNQLSTMQRDNEQRRSSYETVDGNYRKEKEENVRLQARLETSQEKVTSLQHEVLTLRQHNDELRMQGLGKEKQDTQDRINSMLQSLRDDHEKARLVLEEKNSHLNETVLHLKETIRDMESRKSSSDQEIRRLHQELTDAQKKLSIAEASLEVTQRSKEHLETERASLRSELERVQARLEASQQKQAELQAQLLEMTNRLDKAEHSSVLTTQQLASQSATAEAFSKSKEELQHQIHQLEMARTRLESALEHESDKVAQLQRELQDSNQIRMTMEALLSNMKSANALLEDKFDSNQSLQEQVALLRSSNTELQKQADSANAEKTLASHEADDNRGLWESEVKARSKLGLRIAQLERQKQEVLAQVEEEKKRTRKALELKKVAESKLTGESERTDQMTREINTLKHHLKSARKKLKALDSKENPVNALQADFNLERVEMERTISTLRRQLDDMGQQLATESSNKANLESKSRQLQQELSSLKGMDKNFTKLERGKRKVEEEFAMFKAHVANNYIEKTKLQMARAELEAQARIELNKKLEEVNKYLEEQAEARERLDRMREVNESDMRREFEKTKKDLREEINRLRSSFNDSQLRKETNDMETQKFRDLYDNEVKLRERLADKLQRATEKATQAQLILDRQRVGGSYGSAFLDGWLSPPKNYGVNDALSHRLRAELDRSIHKHLEKSPQIDISVPNHGKRDDAALRASFNKSANNYLDVLRSSYLIS